MNTLELIKSRRSVSAYRDSGVNTEEADAGLSKIVSRIKQTWPRSGDGQVKLDIGMFANVLDIGGMGIAICTDGVGSKTIIAQMMDKYDTIGIDCVAMNVNDLICVGARPTTLVDYIAIEHATESVLDGIAAGLCAGAASARISISGGEIAQLKDIVHGFDLVGTCIGHVDLDKIVIGQDVREGDVVIGIRSNGVHSNGLSLARKAFFENNDYKISHKFSELDCTLGEELLKPTYIYVQETMELLKDFQSVKALVNITSDGFLNLTRVASDVGYIIEHLPEPHPIFSLIQDFASVDDTEMFEVFNMGIGFCVVVDPAAVGKTLSVLEAHGRDASVIGYAVSDAEKLVRIPQYRLEGKGKKFCKK